MCVTDTGTGPSAGLEVSFITGHAQDAVVGNGTCDAGVEVSTKPVSPRGRALRTGFRFPARGTR